MLFTSINGPLVFKAHICWSDGSLSRDKQPHLPNVLISVAFFFSIAIFLPRVLMCQKLQISLPVGYKTATPKTGDWEQLWRQFRTLSFAKNRFLSHFLIHISFSYTLKTVGFARCNKDKCKSNSLYNGDTLLIRWLKQSWNVTQPIVAWRG